MTSSQYLANMLEGYYLNLLYRFFFQLDFSAGETEVLIEGIDYYIKKIQAILGKLNGRTIITLATNDLSIENGDIIVFYAFLNCFCSKDIFQIIAGYQINSDSSQIQETLQNKEKFCESMIWALSHLMRIYNFLIIGADASDDATNYQYETTTVH